jgi:hypothetical protein
MRNETPVYFDYVSVARKAGLDSAQIGRLAERWEADYGADRNLLELRLLRVCRAIEKGACTFDEALAAEPDRLPGFAA